MKRYQAHWGWLLIGLSTFLTVMCVGGALMMFYKGAYWVGALILGMVLGCALFCVRSYTVTPEAVLIERLLWSTRLPLGGLQLAQREKPSWWCGIRIGNGGFYSFTGWRWNPRLGFYRVFVTDPNQAVSLRFAKRLVILSPSEPDDFVQEVMSCAAKAA